MKIISREDAISLGLTRYFTGKPCKRGHISFREVVNCNCVDCSSEAAKRRYHRDPDAAREKARLWREANPEKCSESNIKSKRKAKEKSAKYWQEYYRKNKERLSEARKEYIKHNRDRNLAAQREWREKNRPRRAALQSKRKASQRQAVPSWFGELDKFVWQEAADLARLRFELTGIRWEADHMIPLAGRKACGLHVAANCQVIPAAMNLFKSNKMILTERLEWLK